MFWLCGCVFSSYNTSYDSLLCSPFSRLPFSPLSLSPLSLSLTALSLPRSSLARTSSMSAVLLHWWGECIGSKTSHRLSDYEDPSTSCLSQLFDFFNMLELVPLRAMATFSMFIWTITAFYFFYMGLTYMYIVYLKYMHVYMHCCMGHCCI